MSDDYNRKEQFVEQMCGLDEVGLRHALQELRKKGWLRDGSLRGICLRETNFEGENLWGADLQNVDFCRANLQGANLQGSRLQGAVLDGANLQAVELRSSYIGSAKFSEDTILPDGNHWMHDMDMTRFTDPNHSDFWRSDDPKSPAYLSDKR